jgi:hypothetical protein
MFDYRQHRVVTEQGLIWKASFLPCLPLLKLIAAAGTIVTESSSTTVASSFDPFLAFFGGFMERQSNTAAALKLHSCCIPHHQPVVGHCQYQLPLCLCPALSQH